MKKTFLIISLIVLLLTSCEKSLSDGTLASGFSVIFHSDNSIEVQVPIQSPGTLQSCLTPNLKKHISILRLNGKLNGDDIQAIRDVKEYQENVMGDQLFKELDLSDCDFVPGGHFSYLKKTYMNVGGESVTIVVDSIEVIPNTAHAIPPYAFAALNLQSVALNPSLTIIGKYAFEINTIRDFAIPSSVKEIGEGAFHFTYIQSAITVPEGVTVLPDSVFFNASQMPAITLPTTIQSLGRHCFGDCLHLSEITVKSENPPTCDNTLWNDWYIGTRTLYVPKGSIEKYRAHPVWGLADIITEIKQ